MVQMKNWDPLVSRPALAMATEPTSAITPKKSSSNPWGAGKRTEDTGSSVLQLEVLIGELIAVSFLAPLQRWHSW